MPVPAEECADIIVSRAKDIGRDGTGEVITKLLVVCVILDIDHAFGM